MVIPHSFLMNSIAVFEGQKRTAEAAISQLSDAQLHQLPYAGGNSIVIQMKHLAGNMRSRWTNFLASDGEKASRDRDGEFVDDFESRAQLDAVWAAGWSVLLATMRSLEPEDLERSVTIRGSSHSVLDAIQRQISHYSYHVGQIVQQARMLTGPSWKSLSIARGASAAWNEKVGFTPQ